MYILQIASTLFVLYDVIRPIRISFGTIVELGGRGLNLVFKGEISNPWQHPGSYVERPSGLFLHTDRTPYGSVGSHSRLLVLRQPNPTRLHPELSRRGAALKANSKAGLLSNMDDAF